MPCVSVTASIVVHHGRHSKSHRANIGLSQHCFASPLWTLCWTSPAWLADLKPASTVFHHPLGPRFVPGPGLHLRSTRSYFGSRHKLYCLSFLSPLISLAEEESERSHSPARLLTPACLLIIKYRQRPTVTTISYTIRRAPPP